MKEASAFGTALCLTARHSMSQHGSAQRSKHSMAQKWLTRLDG